MKTHHAAVAVVPQRELWDPIQAIRRRYDWHFQCWMSHLTLLYPFWPQAMFDRAEPALRHACASVPRFGATLREIYFFAHGRDHGTPRVSAGCRKTAPAHRERASPEACMRRRPTRRPRKV